MVLSGKTRLETNHCIINLVSEAYILPLIISKIFAFTCCLFMKGYKCYMSLKLGLPVILESCERSYRFFMRQIEFCLDNAFFAPINWPQNEISTTWYVRPANGSDQPAHMRSLIRAFASCLTIIWLLRYWPIRILSMCYQQRLRPACAYFGLIRAFASRLTIIWLLSYWSIGICSF